MTKTEGIQKKFRNTCSAIWTETPPIFDEKYMIYLCYQQEIAPSTGNLHWQTYAEFKQAYAGKYIQKYLNAPKCHLEARKGSPTEARAYCCNNEAFEKNLPNAKDKTNGFIKDSFKEFGDFNKCPLVKTKSGQRTDLEKLAEKLDKGAKLEDLDTKEVIKYSKGIKEALALREKKTNNKWTEPEVIVLWGSAGSKKTKSVYDKEGFENVYKLDKTNNEVWFDGYAGEKVLLIDDFYGWIPWGQLLNILDGYPLKLQIKGSHTWKAWEKVYITSNKPFEEWYKKDSEEHLDPLRRRIKYIVKLDKPRTEIRQPILIDASEFFK